MFDADRLERLISAHFDGMLDAPDRAELEAMLLSSSRARQVFLDSADFHGLLRDQALQANGVNWLEGNRPKAKSRRPAVVTAVAGLAACLALGWWWTLAPVPPTAPVAVSISPPRRDEVALLGMAVDVEWNSPPFAAGEAMPSGLVDIRKGMLRLDFYSGARVVLEGPAKLELMTASLARLDEGKLTAKVPPPAQGFTVLNGNLRVVDRGTQFGMRVTGDDNCAVHVFDGEVELQGEVPVSAARNLFEGEAIAIHAGKSTALPADRDSFADPVGILRAAAKQTEARWENWRVKSQRLRGTAGLLTYFDFEGWEPTSMSLRNEADSASESSNGSVIGCEKLTGRWDQKTALGFAKTSDRVRFRVGQGSSRSITLAAWVRVDSLPLDHNSLLSMAPGEIGEVHWKLDRTGCLLLGLRAAPEHDFKSWERLESPPVVTPNGFGRWIHLATVIDGENHELRHYANGALVASGPLVRPTAVQLGLANLGNLDGTWHDLQPVRNFNGRIDEFALFGRALTEQEIADLQ